MLHFGFAEYFIVGAILFILAVDAVLLAKGGDRATISDRTALWAMRYPIIAVLAGVLIGHLFWPNLGYCP